MSYYHPHYSEGVPGESGSGKEHYQEEYEHRDYRKKDERISPRQSHSSTRPPHTPMNPTADLGISPWASMYGPPINNGRPNLEALATDLNAVSEFVAPERLSERSARPRAHGGLNTLYRHIDDPPQFFIHNSNQQYVPVYQSSEQPVFSDNGSNAWDRHADAETGSRTSFTSYDIGDRASGSSISESLQDERPYPFDDHLNSPNLTRPYPRSPQSDSHQGYHWTANPRSHHTVSDVGNSEYAGSECTRAPHLQVNDTPYRSRHLLAQDGSSSRQTNGHRHVRIPSTNSITNFDPLHSTLSRSSSGSGPRVSTRGNTHSAPRRRAGGGRQRNQPPTHPAASQPATSDEPRTPRFPCDYAFAGCASTFASKNEWKRHLATQHLQEHLWRCNLSACRTTGRGTSAFNRKDLLGQHIKRMHRNTGPQTLQQMQDSMKFLNRVMPQESECGFCGMLFCGEGSWDKRMEHVGKHYEEGHDEGYQVGQAFITWSLRERLIKVVNGKYALVAAGKEQAQMGGEAVKLA